MHECTDKYLLEGRVRSSSKLEVHNLHLQICMLWCLTHNMRKKLVESLWFLGGWNASEGHFKFAGDSKEVCGGV